MSSNTFWDNELTPAFKALRGYVGFLAHKFYYNRVWYVNPDHVPAGGTPLVVVGDHQNSLNDSLGYVFSIKDRKVHFLTRSDIFTLGGAVSKFLYWLGLLPSFRLKWDGAEALANNKATFSAAEDVLLKGGTVTLFPEAGHQDKHWLGPFTSGYLQIAFNAAERSGYSKEIFILPTCNHYSEYFGLRTDMMVRYGTPVSIAPYYELYKTRPRTAKRQVDAIVRAQIKDMMLDIEDLDNYTAIDYIRTSAFGEEFSRVRGMDPDKLPEKLESDKMLVAGLAGCGEEENSRLYGDVRTLLNLCHEGGFGEGQMSRKVTPLGVGINFLILLLTAPLALFCLWPSVISWGIPRLLAFKMKDKMLLGSFVLGLNALFILPVCGLITLVCTWIGHGFLRGVIYAALLPVFCVLEWFWYTFLRDTVKDFNFLRNRGGKASSAAALRENIFAGLRSRFGVDGPKTNMLKNEN